MKKRILFIVVWLLCLSGCVSINTKINDRDVSEAEWLSYQSVWMEDSTYHEFLGTCSIKYLTIDSLRMKTIIKEYAEEYKPIIERDKKFSEKEIMVCAAMNNFNEDEETNQILAEIYLRNNLADEWYVYDQQVVQAKISLEYQFVKEIKEQREACFRQKLVLISQDVSDCLQGMANAWRDKETYTITVYR